MKMLLRSEIGFPPDEYRYCFLRIAERDVVMDDGEPSRFLHIWKGMVLLDREDGERTVSIGLFTVMVADVEGAISQGVSPFDVFDSESSSIGYFETIYEDSSDVKDQIIKLACNGTYVWRPNLLMLDRLAIFPEHRGKNVGLLVLHALMEHFSIGVGLVAMKPFPLQFEVSSKPEVGDVNRSDLGLDAYSCPIRTATAKLKKHYRKLGFKAIPRTEYMVRDADSPLPSIDSLLPK